MHAFQNCFATKQTHLLIPFSKFLKYSHISKGIKDEKKTKAKTSFTDEDLIPAENGFGSVTFGRKLLHFKNSHFPGILCPSFSFSTYWAPGFHQASYIKVKEDELNKRERKPFF